MNLMPDLVLPSSENTSSTAMGGQTAQEKASPLLARTSDPPKKNATVIGIFGVQGCGKSHLLKQLKESLPNDKFVFHEIYDVIHHLDFRYYGPDPHWQQAERIHLHQQAIQHVGKECAASGKVGVVAAHFMLWPEQRDSWLQIPTDGALAVYSHALYLDVPANIVFERRGKASEVDSNKRSRPLMSIDHLERFRQAEMAQLRKACRTHGILFSAVSPGSGLVDHVTKLLNDFEHHTEEVNLSRAQKKLDETMTSQACQLKTMLVFDADRTLAAEDTGQMFWEIMCDRDPIRYPEYPLKAQVGSPLFHSYTEYRRTALLYEECGDDEAFNNLCEIVAAKVSLYPEIRTVLELAQKHDHIGALVVTSGLRLAWEKVLDREGLSQTVKIIGGCRISDGFIVSADVKRALVDRLQDKYQLRIWAFGDAPVDLEMLKKADQAVVVVGDEGTRSETMNEALEQAVGVDGLRVRQAVLADGASPRLDTLRLPLVDITDHAFMDSIIDDKA